eukprot:SAG31_NODE_2705_length_5215_cov_9.452502_7_plen_83_part_00
MYYPPFAHYDSRTGYDRSRYGSEKAPTGDLLGWIEYTRDQDEGAKAIAGGDMSHLRPRMADEERCGQRRNVVTFLLEHAARD